MKQFNYYENAKENLREVNIGAGNNIGGLANGGGGLSNDTLHRAAMRSENPAKRSQIVQEPYYDEIGNYYDEFGNFHSHCGDHVVESSHYSEEPKTTSGKKILNEGDLLHPELFMDRESYFGQGGGMITGPVNGMHNGMPNGYLEDANFSESTNDNLNATNATGLSDTLIATDKIYYSPDSKTFMIADANGSRNSKKASVHVNDDGDERVEFLNHDVEGERRARESAKSGRKSGPNRTTASTAASSNPRTSNRSGSFGDKEFVPLGRKKSSTKKKKESDSWLPSCFSDWFSGCDCTSGK